MPNIKKYDNSTRLAIIDYYSKGLKVYQIAERLGVHRNTVTKWIMKENLKPIMEEAKKEYLSGKTLDGTIKLVEGAKSYKRTKRYNSDGECVEILEEERQEIPDLKAIQLLARICNIELSDIAKNTDSNGNILINTDMLDGAKITIRDIQLYNKNNNPLGENSLASEDITLNNSEYKEKDSE
jgi:transposase